MHTYIIAEIGQNHNGSMQMAKKLIDAAAMPIFDHFYQRQLPGVDAVKFTVRDLTAELDNESWSKPYKGLNSFGPTYGQHRKFLEFDDFQIRELERYAHDKGLEFVLTICNTGRLSILENVNIDRIKIASRDINNIPLLKNIPVEIPVILSLGMAKDNEQVYKALDALPHSYHNSTLLHCVSAYPTDYEWANLNRLGELELIHKRRIGLSDHTIGIMLPIAAVARGAKVIEKHFTLSRTLRGSDHFCSLEPEGMWRMVRDIRNLELAMKHSAEPKTVQASREKLGRSLAWASNKVVGDEIGESDFHMISPGGGMEWDDMQSLIGRSVRRGVMRNDLVRNGDIDNG